MQRIHAVVKDGAVLVQEGAMLLAPTAQERQ
jgi:hypothetical protein